MVASPCTAIVNHAAMGAEGGFRARVTGLDHHPPLVLVLAVTGVPAKAGVVGCARNPPVAGVALRARVQTDRLNPNHLVSEAR